MTPPIKKTTTYVPPMYTGDDFNKWQLYLQKELDKVRKTDVAKRIIL